MKRFGIALILISFAIAMGSCGGGNSSGTYQGTSRVIITLSDSHFAKIEINKDTLFASVKHLLKEWMRVREASAIPSNIVNIQYTVSGTGMTTMTGTVPVSGSDITISLDVPNGPQRHFLLEALDANGVVDYSGDAYADLNGTPVTITIQMTATTPIDVSGSWSIYNTPQGQSENAPACITITQTGNSFTFSGIDTDGSSFTGSGTINGNQLQFTVSGTDSCYGNTYSWTATATGTTDGSTMSGTYTRTGGCPSPYTYPYDAGGTWRAVKWPCTISPSPTPTPQFVDLYPGNVVAVPGSVSFDVVNSGTVAASNVYVVVQWSDGIYNSCQSFTVTVLPGSSVPLSVIDISYTTYTIRIDPYNTIPESNESNNVVCSGLFCTSPPPLSICP